MNCLEAAVVCGFVGCSKCGAASSHHPGSGKRVPDRDHYLVTGPGVAVHEVTASDEHWSSSHLHHILCMTCDSCCCRRRHVRYSVPALYVTLRWAVDKHETLSDSLATQRRLCGVC
jgi:hypothetical protein